MNDRNSVTDRVIDGLVAVELFLGLATVVALAAAVVSTIGHVAGFGHEVSVTATLYATSGVLLLFTFLTFLASIEVQHFSPD